MEIKEIKARQVCELFGRTRSWLSTQVAAKVFVPLRYTGKGYVYDGAIVIPMALKQYEKDAAELGARAALLAELGGGE